MTRRAAKVDANHAEIVDALRASGCYVQSLASIGKGCPDLLVGAGGIWLLMEVKDGNKPPSARALTPDEQRWAESAAVAGCRVHVVNSAVEALEIVSAALARRQVAAIAGVDG